MKHCQSCKTEYVEDVKFCPDCGSALLEDKEWQELLRAEDLERTRLKGIKMAPVCPVGSRLEAMQYVTILEQENIPVFVRTWEETAYDGLFVTQKGWGEIWVADNRYDEALKLVEEIRKSQPIEPPAE